MFDVWKSVIFLSLGLTISVAAVKIRCYGQSLNEYEDFELSEMEKLVESQYYTKNVDNFMIIHGFLGNLLGRFVTNTTLAYIRAEATYVTETLPSVYNVLALDWSKEASANPILGEEASYFATGISAAHLAGEELADSMASADNIGFIVNLTTLIGHSLGAHNAGHCGRKLKVYGLELKRILGLDPSGPGFDGPLPLDTPLKKDCARFVQCVHTDPGNKGINSSYGHIDVWVNYGLFFQSNKTKRVQPGCPIGNFPTFSIDGTCSHDFSWKLLNFSLVAEFSDLFLMSFGINYWEWARSNGTATPVTKMPEKTDTTLRGNFFFSASGDPPHGLGEAGLRPVYETNEQGSRRFSIFNILLRQVDHKKEPVC